MIASLLGGAEVLYLKDGTRLDVLRYQVSGDRVRYLDPVSKQWEEVPSSMVDWNKTRQQQAAPQTSVTLRKGERVSLGPPARERGYRIDHDLYVPNEGGVYTVLNSRVLSLARAATVLHQNKARRILNAVAIPVFSSQTEIRLPGEQGAVRFPAGSRVFYIRDDWADEVEAELLQLEPRQGRRVVSRISQGAVTGKAAKKNRSVPVVAEAVESFLIKLTIDALPAGEYAIWLRPKDVELKKGQVLAETGVWDFGVD